MIRLFFGLELPGEIRMRIGAISRGIDGARWVAPEDLHITLRFIGEATGPAMEEIAAEAASIRFDPFAVTLAGAGHFERRGRVGAVWIGVEPEPALSALRERIEAAAARAGQKPERRRFRPHVTVARLSRARPGEVRDWLAANTLFRAVPFTVDGFALFSSTLGRHGSTYTAECRFPVEG